MLRLSNALALTVALDELVKILPDVDTARLSKALSIAAEHKIEYKAALGAFVYQSPDAPFPYVVHIGRALKTNDLHDAFCTCADFTERGSVCKHICSAWLVNRSDEILSAAAQLRTISAMDSLDRYIQWALG